MHDLQLANPAIFVMLAHLQGAILLQLFKNNNPQVRFKIMTIIVKINFVKKLIHNYPVYFYNRICV